MCEGIEKELEGIDLGDKRLDRRSGSILESLAANVLETGPTSTGNIALKAKNISYAFALERSSEGERTSLLFVEQLGIDPSVDARIAELEQTPRALAAFSLQPLG